VTTNKRLYHASRHYGELHDIYRLPFEQAKERL
jgi:hypothetical protein